MSTCRILTQNCCLLPTHVYQARGADNRSQRAQLIVRLVQRYDVVLLQEVFSTMWCKEWRKLFAAVPELVTVNPERGNKLLDSGLVVLSRYPVIASSFHRFRSKPLTNSIIDRGFLYAKLDAHGRTLHVINTHLAPSEWSAGFHSSQEYRRRQLDEMLAFKAQQKSAPDDIWIVGGDFNDERVVMRMPTDMDISLVFEQPPTSHNLVPYAIPSTDHKCIDYLVTSCGQLYAKRVESLVSDHYGVEVAVALG